MKYLVFGKEEKSSYRIAVLVTEIRKDEILQNYIHPKGIDPEDVIVIQVMQDAIKKKTPMKDMQGWIQSDLAPVFNDLNVEYVLCGDSEYFKALTKSATTERLYGYVVDSVFGGWKILAIPNWKQVFYDPAKVEAKIAICLTAMQMHMTGTYITPGIDIIKFEDYPETVEAIRLWLNQLLEMDKPLAADIEAFNLKHHNAGIASISFSWNKSEGIAFPVDLLPLDQALQVRALLKQFFIDFQNRLIWHNIAFDVYVLIYQLFMEHLLDTEGLLAGLEIMLRNWDDTKLISYLATNSCAGNKLGLKDQAQEYAGNYAVEDITDVRKIPLPELLRYNLVDTMSTWYVYEKHYQTMINDNQLEIYEEIFKPAIVEIIQMQLTGMPVDMDRVLEVETILTTDRDNALKTMANSSTVNRFIFRMTKDWADEKNANRVQVEKDNLAAGRKLQHIHYTPSQSGLTFNPNSGPQLIKLLFGDLGLPVLERTKKAKLPKTGAETLGKLVNHTQDPDIIAFLNALVDFKAVDKILNSFIPAFKKAVKGPDGWHYLFGNFNLGGTVSGRLSSNKPNLQNLPSTGSKYAKLIKSIFRAPPGWLFCGIDFNALEDRISALTTKDPNKLKVYTDGFDGHSMRAFNYFSQHMPDIDPTSVASINSIADRYKNWRQLSKAPTFALTYQGTYQTLMVNCGFTEELAKDVEAKYHILYEVSDKWISAKLDEATKTGYVTAAFGLRIRTPLLKQIVARGTRHTPREAEAEGRTAGNGLGQSWCLLNNRAGSEEMSKIRKSKYRLDIRPCAHIHDARYYLIRDDLNVVEYANEVIVKATQWQDHPDIWHDEVKLGGEFAVFHPTWAEQIDLPNGVTAEQIPVVIREHYKEEARKAAEKAAKKKVLETAG